MRSNGAGIEQGSQLDRPVITETFRPRMTNDQVAVAVGRTQVTVHTGWTMRRCGSRHAAILAERHRRVQTMMAMDMPFVPVISS
jgi:hypothetical protein